MSIKYEEAKKELNLARQDMIDVAIKHMSVSELEEFKAYMKIVTERALAKYQPVIGG